MDPYFVSGLRYTHRLRPSDQSAPNLKRNLVLQFPIRKAGIFRPGKEIKGLRGGVHRYAAQGNPKIDTAGAERALSGWKLAQFRN